MSVIWCGISSHRQAVDEQAQIKCPLRFIPATAELARHRKAVGVVKRPGFVVAGRGRTVEEIDMVRSVIDASAQDVDFAIWSMGILIA